MCSLIFFVIPIHVFQASSEVPTPGGSLSCRSWPWCPLFSTEKLPVGLPTPTGLASNCYLSRLWPPSPGILPCRSNPSRTEKSVAVWFRKGPDQRSKCFRTPGCAPFSQFSFLILCLSISLCVFFTLLHPFL